MYRRLGGLEAAMAGRSAEDELLDRFTDDEVKQALEDLPEQFRVAVLLADVEGFSYKEIAEILDIPIGTVMSRLHRGRKGLRASVVRLRRGRRTSLPKGRRHVRRPDRRDRAHRAWLIATTSSARCTRTSTARPTIELRVAHRAAPRRLPRLPRDLRLPGRAAAGRSPASATTRCPTRCANGVMECLEGADDQPDLAPRRNRRREHHGYHAPHGPRYREALVLLARLGARDRRRAHIGRPGRRLHRQGRGPSLSEATAEVAPLSSNLVDWGLAERIATRLARETIPSPTRYHYASLQPDFAELTAQAEELVAECTGLGRRPARRGPGSPTAPDGCRRTSPRSSDCCVRSPTARRAAAARPARRRSRRRSPASRSGTLLGWMSGRVLGQYDLLVVDDERRRPGPRVLRRPERARPREALRVPAPGVPSVARAPRGDPPGAVHRRAVDARALPRRWSSRPRRRSTPTPSASSTPRRRRRRARRGGRNPLDDGGLVRRAGDARAARGARQDRRADEPARGPRRRDHGPRRRRASSRAPPGSAGCCANSAASRAARRQGGAAAHRARGEAGAVRAG